MGKKSDEVSLLSTKWITFSALGLILFSAGILAIGEAVYMRVTGKDLAEWLGVVVIGIIIVNAGISFIGTSIKYRIYLDRKRKQDSELRSQRGGGSTHRHRHSSSGRSSGSSAE